MTVEKVVYMSGRLRPGGIDLKRVATARLSVVKGATATVVTVPMIPVAADKNTLRMLMIPINKTWASREPYKTGLNAPALTIISVINESSINARIEYNIPPFPDWLKSTVMSSIDGVVSILSVPTDLTGAITDHAATLFKTHWSDVTYAPLNLPIGLTDCIWVQHEYQFGGIINSDLTPLPLATSSTTTTTASTTTTSPTTTEPPTTGPTTTSPTTTEPTTTEPTTTTHVPVYMAYMQKNEPVYNLQGEGPFTTVYWCYYDLPDPEGYPHGYSVPRGEMPDLRVEYFGCVVKLEYPEQILMWEYPPDPPYYFAPSLVTYYVPENSYPWF